ncbi:hypothetical protein [Marininema halotolerans]|nr:hypothetical protein [Marininema halotolerans]
MTAKSVHSTIACGQVFNPSLPASLRKVDPPIPLAELIIHQDYMPKKKL